MKKVMIVGGTSGLGFEIAKRYLALGYEVHVVGRKNRNENREIENLYFQYLDLDGANNDMIIEKIVREVGKLDDFIYAPGFFQNGRISELTPREILKMNRVGGEGAQLFLHFILKKQNSLENFIAITSTSQFTPREMEPIYTYVKAGLQALSKSISEDKKVKHTLVFAPGGMNTDFFGDGRDMSVMLDPSRVAEVVLEERDKTGRYREVAMFRGKGHAELRAELDPKEKFQK